jgi:hypothetical protein
LFLIIQLHLYLDFLVESLVDFVVLVDLGFVVVDLVVALFAVLGVDLVSVLVDLVAVLVSALVADLLVTLVVALVVGELFVWVGWVSAVVLGVG